ncbi:hypothetical protein D3C78_1837130 [compost metagenome]
MAVKTEQLPIGAVRRVVVMVVIAVVHREFRQPLATEFAATAAADPGIQLKRLFPVTLFASLAFVGQQLVQLVRRGRRGFRGHAPLLWLKL